MVRRRLRQMIRHYPIDLLVVEPKDLPEYTCVDPVPPTYPLCRGAVSGYPSRGPARAAGGRPREQLVVSTAAECARSAGVTKLRM